MTFCASTIFSGLGGGALGLQEAGFELVGGIDSDPAAAADYEYLTGSPCTVADLQTMTVEEFRAVHSRRPDFLLTSPPCLPGDELVITRNGKVPISTIRQGDEVLTHRGRYRRVLAAGTHQYSGDLHRVYLNGEATPRTFTSEHPLWRRRQRRGTDKKRRFTDPEFCRADQVKVGDRIGFPITPAFDGAEVRFIDSLGMDQVMSRPGSSFQTKRIIDMTSFAGSQDLWFLAGVFLGDGYRRHDSPSVVFCVGPRDGEEFAQVVAALDRLELNYHVDAHAGDRNVKVITCGRQIYTIMGAFGDLALGKMIPEEVFSFSDDNLRAIWKGCLISDGNVSLDEASGEPAHVSYSSINMGLLHDIKRMVLRLGLVGMIHTGLKAGHKSTIEGREVVSKHNLYHMRVRLKEAERTPTVIIEDGVAWSRVKSIEIENADLPVFNMEVEEDNTFCVPMMATHNCKAFSGCLPISMSRTPKYRDMSSLAQRGIMLALEAFSGDPIPLIALENVPRIMSRGREWLDQIVALLQAYGYSCRETTHDCGELGGLAQHRRRFLLVARHMASCPEFLYVPPVRRVRGVGEVLASLPVPAPGSDAGGPMHRRPKLSPLNALRLALIPAGGDWRDLPERVALPPREARQNGGYGVNAWEEGAHAVVATAQPSVSWSSTADPRVGCSPRSSVYGVLDDATPCGTVVGAASHDNGRFTRADPRILRPRREGSLGVRAAGEPSAPVIGACSIQNHPAAWADARLDHSPRPGALGCVAWGEAVGTVIGDARSNKGHNAADPRIGTEGATHNGKYGVESWNDPAHTIISEARTGKAWAAVADPAPLNPTHWIEEVDGEPVLCGPPVDLDDTTPGDLVIRSLDGTNHRPMTTLELAALQGLPVWHNGDWLQLGGRSHQAWRQRIGNAIPPPAAEAIGRSALATLQASRQGTLLLCGEPVWVSPAEALL